MTGKVLSSGKKRVAPVWTLAWVLLTAAIPVRHALGAPPDGGPGGGPPGANPAIDPRWEFMAFAMAAEKVVKGAPYSAESVYEFHQVLGDGNRIDRRRSAVLYRDSEGRTRQEVADPHPMIFLNDPVAHRRYLLDPENHAAVLLAGERNVLPSDRSQPGFLGSIGLSLHRAWNQLAGVTGLAGSTEPAPRGADVAPAGPVPHNSDAPPPPPPDPGPFGPPGPGPHHGGPEDGMGPDGRGLPLVFREPRGPGVIASLGTREFDSVKAQGSRTTWTIPAGQLGNEKPLVSTSDQWVVPDLFLTVYARDYDPRDGETIYQIKNLKRDDPPAELFTVPADYRLVVAPRLPVSRLQGREH